MHAWSYVSESLLDPDKARLAIDDIVRVSRSRNAKLKVTGALLFNGLRFAQYIEGSEKSIGSLRLSILADARHCRVATLEFCPVRRRVFPGWSLVYFGQSRYLERLLDRVDLDQPQQSEETRTALSRMFVAFAQESSGLVTFEN